MSEERAHAKLSASSAKRWLNCTPAPSIEAELEDRGSNYAREGTDAHTLGEVKLRVALGLAEDVAIDRTTEALEFFDAEMHEATDLYQMLVVERYEEARKQTRDAVIQLEQRLDFSDWVPDGFGTGDVVIIADGVMDVIDLKYGKGVPVDAEENPQLMLYGLGAIAEFGSLYEIETVRLTIVQPRLESVSTWEVGVEALIHWGEEYVKPRAEEAFAGRGECSPGDWCQFCKARPICRALADQCLELAAYEFRQPALLTAEEVGDVLGRVDQLTRWAASVQQYAQEQAERLGTKWPGWKLVEGRSNRKYTDQAAVEVRLVANGVNDIYKPVELKGITDMEKTVGKKRFETILGDLIVKPAGKPTLVPESDKRPEIQSTNSAAADFAAESEE